ncbi:hypothetical protein [Pseudomonas fulva]|uniref:hypothetical protein n=1 Tax=Pseudomonas fulva TaxID=47880 RepID=UPI00384ADC4C
MTIDRQKFKALAEAATKVPEWYSPQSFGLSRVTGETERDFIGAAGPGKILALLAEIEQLQEHKQHLVDLRETHGFDCWAAALVEIDRFKAENEALRTGQAIKRLSGHEVREAYNGAYYQARDTGSDGEQCRAGVLAVIEVATAKEASHD